jgi:hypothetical protein
MSSQKKKKKKREEAQKKMIKKSFSLFNSLSSLSQHTQNLSSYVYSKTLFLSVCACVSLSLLSVSYRAREREESFVCAPFIEQIFPRDFWPRIKIV